MFWFNVGQAVARRYPRPAAVTRLYSSTQTPPNAPNVPPPSASDQEAIATLMDIFELPATQDVHTLLGTQHKHVLAESAYDIRLSFDQLRALDLNTIDIRRQPRILAKNALTIANHHQVLHEIGFQQVTVASLVRYIRILNQSTAALKAMHFIPDDLHVAQRLAAYLHVQLDADSEALDPGVPIKTLRRSVLNGYLAANFDMRPDEMARIWSTYSNLRNKSFRSVFAAVRACEQLLGMEKARIKQHPYLLYADADNVRQIVELGTLGGIDTRQLLWRRPKIAMMSCRNLQRTEQVIRDFGVPDTAFPRCVEIFTLGYQTVHERLCDMRKIREFDVLVNHPRVLRLVHYQLKARARLEYLRKMKVSCVSLHVLSGGATSFERYARTGVDRTKGADILLLLSQRLGREQAELRALLVRHQNWCHVPVVSVKQALDLLLGRGYSVECIFANVHVLLYPLKRIEEQLAALQHSKDRWGVEPAAITPMQQLQMCLYLIELEFHFEGDGIWLEPWSDATVSAPVVGETEFDMLGDYKKTLGPIRVELGPDALLGHAAEAATMPSTKSLVK